MKKITKPAMLPDSECDREFLQGMVNRRAHAFIKYGSVHANKREDFLRSLEARLAKYRADGNTEWLVDVAVYAWVEFMNPRHPDAHFRATASHESPGNYMQGEINPTTRRNTDL